MRRRLIIVLTAVMTLFWLCAAGLGAFVMHDEFSEIFDSSLKETAERLLPLVVDDLGLQSRFDKPRRLDLQTIEGEEYLIYQVRDPSGKVLLHSHGSTATPFAAPLKPGYFDLPTQRIYTVSTRNGSIFVQVADPLDHRAEAAEEGGMSLFLPLLVLVPASALIIHFVARRMLVPVETLRNAIATKNSGNLAPLEIRGLPSEILPISQSVNLLLERLRAALDAEREFTSNSAHELRTPIAGALAQVQRLQAEVPPEFVPRVDKIEHSLSHLARLSEKLLQLSRAEAGIGMAHHQTDLVSILHFVVDDISRARKAKGRIHFGNGEGVELLRSIDADAFAIVIRNLTENALIHSPPRSAVSVDIDEQGTITISNRGPLLDPAFIESMGNRFTRGPTAADGSGLGLSIVRKLVAQMNGEIRFQSPARGAEDGFSVTLTFAA